MTDQSSNGDGDRQTVQILVYSDSDREALNEFLCKRYDIVDDSSLQPADCYLLGEQVVPTYRDALQARKQETHPTFTPVLLLQPEGSNGTVPVPSEQNGDDPPLIDEVVSAPVDQTTLFRRVGNLLVRREQSVELSQRYETAQNRFQQLFNSTNDAIFVVTPSGYEITECNPAASTLVAYTRDELRTQSLTDIIHPDDREQLHSFLEDVQVRGRGSPDTLRCQTKNEQTRQLEVTAATIAESGQSQIILSARDVTDRKAYERELKLKSRAMDEAPVGISISDPDQEDNPIIYVNEGFEALTGYSVAEWVGRNCRSLQGEETRDEPVAQMRHAIDNEEPVSVELRNYRKDGTQFWNRVSIAPVRDDTGSVTNWIGFQEDITERKEREQDLQLFKKAVENAGHAVFITDRDGTIEYVNEGFEKRSGYTRTEAIGQTPRILKSGKQDEAFYEQMWETILAGERWDTHLINRRKNGELYHVDQTISPITNDSGEITHFLTIESDVTNRRLREQQLDVLNRVLRHNLRNGTNVIDSHTTLLQDEIEDKELQTHVEAIAERTDALSSLIDQAGTVRSLFDNGSSGDATCDISQLLTEVSDEFSQAYPDANLMTHNLDSVQARADNRLRIALTELLENALVHNDQATPEVTVTTRRITGEEDWIEVEVADNGPGIPDHERETIEQGEETPLQHGTGLGLWIVYWTVSLFGGEVSLEENSPRGTRVLLHLPQATANSQVTRANQD